MNLGTWSIFGRVTSCTSYMNKWYIGTCVSGYLWVLGYRETPGAGGLKQLKIKLIALEFCGSIRHTKVRKSSQPPLLSMQVVLIRTKKQTARELIPPITAFLVEDLKLVRTGCNLTPGNRVGSRRSFRIPTQKLTVVKPRELAATREVIF